MNPTPLDSLYIWMSIPLFTKELGGQTTHMETPARSHQTFRLVQAVELLGIMLRSRRWPTTFLTITAADVDRWCRNRPV